MRIAGLDLSLASTGMAVWDPLWRTPYVDRIETDPETPGASLAWRCKRIRDITAGLLGDLLVVPPDLVVVEGPAYGVGAQVGQHDRAGLWHRVVDDLFAAGVPVAECSPSTLKVYLADNGRASKIEMVRAATAAFPDVVIDGHDVADALGLMALGARHLGHPAEATQLTRKQLKSMDVIRWPERTSRS